MHLASEGTQNNNQTHNKARNGWHLKAQFTMTHAVQVFIQKTKTHVYKIIPKRSNIYTTMSMIYQTVSEVNTIDAQYEFHWHFSKETMSKESVLTMISL